MRAAWIIFLMVGALAWGAVMSPQARKRMEENLSVLEDNLEALKHNREAATKNIETLEGELKDLAELETRHQTLRKKYQGYLDNAEAVPAPKEIKTEKDANQKAAADLALAKQARVRDFLASLDKNILDVRSRREPVRSQIAALKARVTEYERAGGEMGQKKADLEKVLQEQP